MAGEIQETVTPQATIEQLVSRGNDIEFLKRMGDIKTRYEDYLDFMRKAGWSKFTPFELPDVDEGWSALLKNKERVNIHRFSEQELIGDQRTAQVYRRHQPTRRRYR